MRQEATVPQRHYLPNHVTVINSGYSQTLEKEMATHSCILAWKIPWTEDPGRLQSMGLQRARHD